MIKLNSTYPEYSEASSFVAACERAFDETLEAVAADILSGANVRCLTLAGPTCSGKTTTASKLTALLEAGGRRARVISIDDFYYEKCEMDALGITDFEGHSAINKQLFSTVVEKLASGVCVKLPTFDFSVRKRIAMTEYIPREGDIYIFEGIQAIYPQITALLSPLGIKSIYISVAEDISVLGTVFDKNEIRLMRRTVRDYYHRGATVSHTMSLWPAVRANEEANIFPLTGNADYVINSMLPYEIFLIGDYYKRIAGTYPPDGFGAETVRSLLARLDSISGTALEIPMIPMNSVFREFIA